MELESGGFFRVEHFCREKFLGSVFSGNKKAACQPLAKETWFILGTVKISRAILFSSSVIVAYPYWNISSVMFASTLRENISVL